MMSRRGGVIKVALIDSGNSSQLPLNVRHILDVIEEAQVGLWEIDISQGSLQADERWLEIVGRTADDFPETLAQCRIETVHPDNLEEVTSRFEDIVSGRAESYSVEYRYLRPDGETIWVLEKAAVTERSAQGEPLFISGILQDVTAEKIEQQRTLHENAQREYVSTLAGLGGWIWDLEADRIALNADFCALVGIQENYVEDTFGKINKRVLCSDDEPQWRAALEAYLKNPEEAFVHNVRLHHADGHFFWVRCMGTVTDFSVAGRPKIFQGAMLDIDKEVIAKAELDEALRTIRHQNENLEKRVEEEVSKSIQSSRTVEAMFAASPQINILFNKNFQVIDCNRSALDFFGFEDKEQFKKEFLPLIERIQPEFASDGNRPDSPQLRLQEAAEQGYREYSPTLMLDGEPREVRIILKRIPYEESHAVVMYLYDRGEAEARTQLMLDSMPMACFFVDREYRVIDCNHEAVRMFQVSDKRAFQDDFYRFSPEFQPDGAQSEEKALRQISEVFKKGSLQFDWIHLLPSGEEVPCRVVARRVLWAGESRGIFYLWDMRETQRLERERAHREYLMRTANKVAAMLSATAPGLFDYDVWQSLKLLGETAEVDRVAVYQMTTEDDHSWYKSVHGWVRGQDFVPHSDCLNKFDPKDIPALLQKLSSGEIVNVAMADMPKRDRESLQPLGMQVFLAIPIFVLGQFWGAASFGVFEKKNFGETEISVLTIAGQLLSSAILRNASMKELLKTQRDLLAHERLLKTSNRVAKLLLQGGEDDFSATLNKSLRALAIGAQVENFSLWKNYWEDGVLCARRVVAWRKDGTRGTEEVSYSIDYQTYVPEWAEGHPQDGFARPLSEYSQAVQNLDLLKGTKNLLLGPLSYQGEFWGFAAFVREREEQQFTTAQRSILRSGCTMIMTAIERNDLTERIIEAQGELLDQTRLLKAANSAATIILEDEAPDFRSTVREALGVLGKAMDLDRIYIWMNSYEDDTLYCHQIGEWVKPGFSTDKRVRGKRVDFEEHFPGWREPLERDEVIQKTGTEIPLSIFHSAPEAEKIESLLVVPLYAFDTWWGFLGFDDCESARVFSDAQIKIFNSIGTMFVSAIIRSKISEELVEAEELAGRDNLTQLFNRRGFMLRARRLFSEHQSEKRNLAVLFFDLDHFKKINDTYGHLFGDEVLGAFAQVLESNFRPSDLICRYGGEEFVVLVGDAAPEALQDIIGRVNAALSDIAWPYADFTCTTSVGIMSGVPTEDDTLEDYIQKSDEALYRAKQAGRNAVAIY